MERTIIDLELKIVECLAGKLNLGQSYAERKELVCREFLELGEISEEKGLIKKLGYQVDASSAEKFADSLLSLDVIAEFFKDSDVEDIVIDGLNPIFLHTSSKGFIKTDKQFSSIRQLDIFVKKLIIFSGRKNIRNIEPIINLELPDNAGRVNIIQSPYGPQLTITRARMHPLSIINLIDRNTLSFELAAFLWLYVEGLCIKPANIIIAGGPGAGKTTLLNALLAFIPSRERLVIIEDTLELNTSVRSECSRLESGDSVTLQDLVKNSLRMRPDRVIVGEVRGPEAKDLMTSMNIGRFCMGTIHASTGREAILRLQNEPMNVPAVLINLVDVFILMKKIEVCGCIHRVANEVVETAGLELKEVLLCPVWGYDACKNKYTELAPGPYRDHLAKAKGVHPTEIMKEVRQRAAVFMRLKELKKVSYEEVSSFCDLYSQDKTKVLAEIGLNPLRE